MKEKLIGRLRDLSKAEIGMIIGGLAASGEHVFDVLLLGKARV